MEKKTKICILNKRPVLGLSEDVEIIFKNKGKNELFKVKARVDTGAVYSSIDRSLVKKLNLGPGHRTIRIRQSNGYDHRPVIKLNVKIFSKKINTEFTVANREHMKYKLLIGQDILKKGEFLIDPLI